MRVLSVIIFFLLAAVSTAQSLSEVRSEFHSVVLSPDDSEEFHEFMTGIEQPSTTIQAYQAVSEALLAQVLWNPFKKLSQVVKYDKQMTAIVESDPHNVEIRFLRLAIEYNLPSFLGMSTHLEEDADKIVNNLSSVSSMQVNPVFGKYIFHFLKETDLCTDSELQRMKQSFDQGQGVTMAAGVE